MPTILFVDDEAVARTNYKTILTHYGYDVSLASGVEEAIGLLKKQTFDLIITDMRMGDQSGLDMLRSAKDIAPKAEVIILTGHADLQNAVEAMRLGAQDYLTKEADYKEILVVIEKAIEKQVLTKEIDRLRTQLQNQFTFDKIVGSTSAISKIKEIIQRVAPTDSRVLITGESGTGKELVAETIHLQSLRKNGPFIAINCGAIPKDLQESELFGHTKGAFTGADKEKQGLLEVAGKGTVFLDEIGEMSLETQVKLLRFLENGELIPVGAISPRKVDVRVIAATNRNLEDAIKDKVFREDLYYRFKVISIMLPPLRDRLDDIPAIATSLLSSIRERTHKQVLTINNDALEALKAYKWPGNVRELKNVLERAAIFAEGSTIEIEHLPEELFQWTNNKLPVSGQEPDILPLDEIEKRHILSVLERLGGNKLLTAQQLNIATTTLYRKLRQYGIE